MNKDILAYNKSQSAERKIICEMLATEIEANLKDIEGCTSKIWHGAPVWFLNENPIVGYDVLKDSVRLLFWSGQSFDEPELQAEGSFKAAEMRYTDVDQISTVNLARWLEKSKVTQWDYKNIVKRKGVLERLK